MTRDRDYFEDLGYYREDSFESFSGRASNYIHGKEIENPVAIKLASELVSVKSKMLELKYREKKIKDRLLVHIPLHSFIKLDNNWRVESQIHQTPKTFKRLDVLRFLERKYGKSIADSVDEKCTNIGKRNPIIYVKKNKG